MLGCEQQARGSNCRATLLRRFGYARKRCKSALTNVTEVDRAGALLTPALVTAFAFSLQRKPF